MKRFPQGILATVCIPWDSDGQFAESIFRRSVKTLFSKGTKHLYIFGTAGEGYAVSDRQYDQIVAAFADAMRQEGGEPMVGVISLSLPTILERIERAATLGVRQFQISLPSWGALSDDELFAYFWQVCRTFPECQFIHYNLPRAKRIVTGREYRRLADENPNLVATKNTGDSMSHIQSLIEDAPQLQHFLSESGYLHGSLFGECSLLASLVVSWDKIHEHFQAGLRMDIQNLVRIQRECALFLRTLFEIIPTARIDGAYDKIFEKFHHPDYPLRLLPPYIGTSDEEFFQFAHKLRERLPGWLPTTSPR